MALKGPIVPLMSYNVQKVLPAVYDDSLSYYELVARVQHKMDEVVGGYNSVYEAMLVLQAAWEEFRDGGYHDDFVEWVTQWFADNQEYINSLLYDGFYGELVRLDEKIDASIADSEERAADTFTPYPVFPHSKYGSAGQVLSTLADGTTQWANPVVPDEAMTTEIMQAWLAEHPEATTSIPDRGVSPIKTTFIEPKNLLDPDKINTGIRYSPASQKIVAVSAGQAQCLIGLIAVIPGQTYVYHGTAVDYSGGFFDADAHPVIDQTALSSITFSSGHTFTVPAGAYYVGLNLLLNAYETGTYQLEKGTTPTEIVPYDSSFKLDPQYIPDGIITQDMIGDGWIEPINTTFFDAVSHNMINPDNIDMTLYYSPAANRLNAVGSYAYAVTGMIEVKEGETYTYSGTATTNQAGGYFGEGATAHAGQDAIAQITLVDPVSGGGKCFTVPVGQGIKYVCLNLKKTASPFEIDGTYQLEVGEMATPIVPYQVVWKIGEEYLPQSAGPSADVSAFDRLPRPSYAFEEGKLARFLHAMAYKDSDVMVVGTGTSLTARSSEHCTTREDATSRPPLMHSNNFASRIWDLIAWEGQEYRRFDYPLFFIESGTWRSAHDMPEWDDGPYRYGITRYAEGQASFTFEVPEDAWQCNLIIRTDSQGTQAATISVAEGNGQLEAWNGTQWVEANGYVFTERESTTSLTNVSVNDPRTTDNSQTLVASYQVGGNTTYQRRVKMRCKSATMDSRGTTKRVTVSSSSGRLMYWGIEWSPREYMITYVNAARGSHDLSFNSQRSLSHFQDNEIWSFAPDLIFTENPIHNSGGAGSVPNTYYTQYWGYATYDFFFNTDDPISLASRAAALGITDLEWVVFTSSITWNFGGIDEDGQLKLYEDKSGHVMTALDAQEMCYEWTKTNEQDVIAINACKYWCDAAVAMFGDLKTATIGSGKNGDTMTNEGSHWNDTGSAVMARCIGPVFDNYD